MTTEYFESYFSLQLLAGSCIILPCSVSPFNLQNATILQRLAILPSCCAHASYVTSRCHSHWDARHTPSIGTSNVGSAKWMRRDPKVCQGEENRGVWEREAVWMCSYSRADGNAEWHASWPKMQLGSCPHYLSLGFCTIMEPLLLQSSLLGLVASHM